MSEPITREKLSECVFPIVSHTPVDGGYVAIYRCHQYPRLIRSVRWKRGSGETITTYSVDGRISKSLDEALAWLNAPAPGKAAP